MAAGSGEADSSSRPRARFFVNSSDSNGNGVRTSRSSVTTSLHTHQVLGHQSPSNWALRRNEFTKEWVEEWRMSTVHLRLSTLACYDTRETSRARRLTDVVRTKKR